MPKINGKDVRSMEDGREVLASLPNLSRRIDGFLSWLENEPCTKQEMMNGHLFSTCDFQSNSNRMCPACRLQHAFFNCVYNGGAYDSTLDEETNGNNNTD